MIIKKYLCVFVFVCVICLFTGKRSLLAELSQPLFAPNVHSSINWNIEPPELSGLEFIKTGKTSLGEIMVYNNKMENLSYKGIKFNTIQYGFNNNDELIFVAYIASGIDNWAAFKKLAIENYGSGFVRYESNRYYNYVWNVGGYSVALEYDKISKSSVLLLVSG